LSGVAAVLGVAAVVWRLLGGGRARCSRISSPATFSGGTPRSMQIGDILGILVAAPFCTFPLLIPAHRIWRLSGSKEIPAPQGRADGRSGQGHPWRGDMGLALIGVGVLSGLGADHDRGPQPHALRGGMYLPLEEPPSPSSSAALLRWVTDQLREAASFQRPHKRPASENAGVADRLRPDTGRSHGGPD